MRSAIGGIADMLFAEEASDDMALLLSTEEMAADGGHHFGPIAWATFPKRIGVNTD